MDQLGSLKTSMPPYAPIGWPRPHPSEGRLAVHLATGETLRMASSTLGITYETVRTQLKTVFAKTETNRQTELVVVILTTVIFTAPEAT